MANSSLLHRTPVTRLQPRRPPGPAHVAQTDISACANGGAWGVPARTAVRDQTRDGSPAADTWSRTGVKQDSKRVTAATGAPEPITGEAAAVPRPGAYPARPSAPPDDLVHQLVAANLPTSCVQTPTGDGDIPAAVSGGDANRHLVDAAHVQPVELEEPLASSDPNSPEVPQPPAPPQFPELPPDPDPDVWPISPEDPPSPARAVPDWPSGDPPEDPPKPRPSQRNDIPAGPPHITPESDPAPDRPQSPTPTADELPQADWPDRPNQVPEPIPVTPQRLPAGDDLPEERPAQHADMPRPPRPEPEPEPIPAPQPTPGPTPPPMPGPNPIVVTRVMRVPVEVRPGGPVEWCRQHEAASRQLLAVAVFLVLVVLTWLG